MLSVCLLVCCIVLSPVAPQDVKTSTILTNSSAAMYADQCRHAGMFLFCVSQAFQEAGQPTYIGTCMQ